jgi:hypothetical protein
VDSPCPDAARSAPRSSAIRFARNAAPNKIESLRGFPSDGDDIGDAAAGGSFLSSSWTTSSFEKLVAMKNVKSDDSAVESLRCEP